MNESNICFVNTSSTQERIHVANAESAEILRKILAKLENQTWMTESELAALEAPRVVIAPIDTRRHDQRGVKEFRVVLISGSASFRCGTCDVSLEGMRLKSPVPENFHETECLAYISHNDMRENIEVSCEVITGSDGISRLQFVRAEKPELERLSVWIAEDAT